MKHIDRKSVGIEILFANMSSVTSKANELTPKETIERLCEQSYEIRSKISDIINGCIHKLTTDSSIDVKDYLDESIYKLAKRPVSPDSMERLLPFFEWLMDIQRKNSLIMSQAINSLNDAAFHMERDAADFLKTYSNISGQSFSLTEKDGSIVLHTTEKNWGSAELIFPDISTKFTGTFPIIGFLFWIDAEYVNNRFHFSFTIDVEFGDTDSRTRSVQDRNWIRLDFDCDKPYIRLNNRDYGKFIAMNGYRGHSFAEQWCDELILKAAFLGETSLNEKEKNMLTFAQVLKIIYRLTETVSDEEISRDDMQLMDKVLTAMDNRYKFKRIEQIFENIGEKELYKHIDDAMEAWSVGEFGDTRKALLRFAESLRSLEMNGKAGIMYSRLTELMMECTSEFNGESRLYNTIPMAHEGIKACIEPELKKLGFDGEYPHYRRHKRKKGEFISVLMSGMSEHPSGGMMSYRFQISAAVKKLTKSAGRYMAGDIPFENATAEDFRYVSPKTALYTELGGDNDSMVNAVELDAYKTDEQCGNFESAKMLIRLVNLADRAMRGKRTPKWYRILRSKAKAKPESYFDFIDAIMKYMPLGLYLAVLIIGGYLICDRYFFKITDYIPELNAQLTLILSLLIGLTLTLACSLIKMHSLKKRIWRH